jgi:hypothetical protein
MERMVKIGKGPLSSTFAVFCPFTLMGRGSLAQARTQPWRNFRKGSAIIPACKNPFRPQPLSHQGVPADSWGSLASRQLDQYACH